MQKRKQSKNPLIKQKRSLNLVAVFYGKTSGNQFKLEFSHATASLYRVVIIKTN